MTNKALIIGSMGFDDIKNAKGSVSGVLGGAVPYASVAASYFAHTSIVSVVGDDFKKEHLSTFKKRKVNLDGLQYKEGKTFFWAADYDKDFKNAFTRITDLNVFKDFEPLLTEEQKTYEYVFLANMDPTLQTHALKQLSLPKLVACDTMNYWINNTNSALKKLIKKIDLFFVSESEARMLTDEYNLIKAGKKILKMGAKHVVIKLGPNGVMFVSPLGLFQLSPFLVEDITDTTGAGDTFGGAAVGYLSQFDKWETLPVIKRALATASVMASFNIESFSNTRLASLTKSEIAKRLKDYEKSLSL
ncbi:Sugar or nucleoside kinase [Parelusimicrobium proximum]|uniref:PfkB family carbohydrate kinase n=1 Tax=Parelusimicrobium proximum TaxID=3228953 RepID=UPI003D1639F4